MPDPSVPLEKLGFLTIGTFDGADPAPGHEALLQEIELAERLGFDSVWLRHRHLQYGVSSPVTLLAAASQRTTRIEFGTAVTPLGWENPLRYAEDLGTLDVLSGGRMNPGVSVGEPGHYAEVRDALYPDTAEAEDFTYERVLRLLRLLRGDRASSFSGTQGIEVFSERVEPHSPGLADRLWYGAGSERSARWAGEQGLNLLTSSVVRVPEGGEPDFDGIQSHLIRSYRESHSGTMSARVSQGLVVLPTDTATDDQRAKYADYVAGRTPRTTAPQGPGRLLFARDIVGTSDEIAAELYAHAAFREVDEVVFALPFGFTHADYVQILSDMATHLGPALGWSPRG